MTDAPKDTKDEVPAPAPTEDPAVATPPQPVEKPPRKQPDSHVAGL